MFGQRPIHCHNGLWVNGKRVMGHWIIGFAIAITNLLLDWKKGFSFYALKRSLTTSRIRNISRYQNLILWNSFSH
jgi:hypothetical protein